MTTTDVIEMALQKTGTEYEPGQFALAEVNNEQGMLHMFLSISQ